MKNKTMLAKTELEKTEKPLADQLIAEGLQDKIDGFSALLDHEGMVGTVGVYGISRWTPYRHRKASLMAMERRPITRDPALLRP